MSAVYIGALLEKSVTKKKEKYDEDYFGNPWRNPPSPDVLLVADHQRQSSQGGKSGYI